MFKIYGDYGYTTENLMEEFDTYEEARAYRDHINSFNDPPEAAVPDWYMYAEKEIRVVEK